MLQHKKLPHNVLNAKFHEAEAKIIAHAGEAGAITLATNMAGRGTDIQLAAGVAGLGGLKVLGTERHESRRIDRQLRGRCARQGDPGTSKFYVSLEDDLMRLFASRGPLAALLDRTFHEGDMLAHPLLNRSIAGAQKKVEEQNYAIRRRLLQYDDVLNLQREVIYGLRNEVLHGGSPREIIWEMLEPVLVEILDGGQLAEAVGRVEMLFPVTLSPDELEKLPATDRPGAVLERVKKAYGEKAEMEDGEALCQLERLILLRAIDRQWQGHLTEMDDLRHSVGLRSYAQKNPLYEYKAAAFTQFEQLMCRMRRDVAYALFRSASSLEAFQKLIRRFGAGNPAAPMRELPRVVDERIPRSAAAGRNELCPCGSGRKFKKCCGK
jgi:preprotein translocase subunit SecA